MDESHIALHSPMLAQFAQAADPDRQTRDLLAHETTMVEVLDVLSGDPDAQIACFARDRLNSLTTCSHASVGAGS